MLQVLILTGGVLFFGDTMPPKKMAGIAAAMSGIIWCAWGRKEEGLLPLLCGSPGTRRSCAACWAASSRDANARGQALEYAVPPSTHPVSSTSVRCRRYSQIKLAEARQSAAAKLLPQAVSLNGETAAR